MPFILPYNLYYASDKCATLYSVVVTRPAADIKYAYFHLYQSVFSVPSQLEAWIRHNESRSKGLKVLLQQTQLREDTSKHLPELISAISEHLSSFSPTQCI